MQHQVRVEMTEEQVRLSVGDPEHIDRAGEEEHWVYPKAYLHFTNLGMGDVVTATQSRRCCS